MTILNTHNHPGECLPYEDWTDQLTTDSQPLLHEIREMSHLSSLMKMPLAHYCSQPALACTAGPVLQVSEGQTWLGSSELRETKLAESLAAGTANSVRHITCSVKCVVYTVQFTVFSAEFPSNVFVSTGPCCMWAWPPPDYCQSWPAAGGIHTTLWGGVEHTGGLSLGVRRNSRRTEVTEVIEVTLIYFQIAFVG